MFGYAQLGVRGDGVPVIAGRWRRPPYMLSAANMASGVFLCALCQYSVSQPPEWGLPFLRVAIPVLFVLLALASFYRAIWMILMRRRVAPLHSSTELQRAFGLTAAALAHLAEVAGARVRLEINGEEYYNRADFGDAAVLLRAASSPAAPHETLLRAASDQPQPHDQLLRSIE